MLQVKASVALNAGTFRALLAVPLQTFLTLKSHQIVPIDTRTAFCCTADETISFPTRFAHLSRIQIGEVESFEASGALVGGIAILAFIQTLQAKTATQVVSLEATKT